MSTTTVVHLVKILLLENGVEILPSILIYTASKFLAKPNVTAFLCRRQLLTCWEHVGNGMFGEPGLWWCLAGWA